MEGRRKPVAAEGVRGADAQMTARADARRLGPSRVAAHRRHHAGGRRALCRRARAADRHQPEPHGLPRPGRQRDRVLRPGEPPVPARGRGALPGDARRGGRPAPAAGGRGRGARRSSLTTFSGKPIAPEDLQVVQTKRIHLLIVGSLARRLPARAPGAGPQAWRMGLPLQAEVRGRVPVLRRLHARSRPTAASTRRPRWRSTGPPSPFAAGTQAPSWEASGGRRTRSRSRPPRSRSGPGSPRTCGSPSRGTAGGPCRSRPSWAPSPTSSPLTPLRSGFAHIHPNEADVDEAPRPRASAVHLPPDDPEPGPLRHLEPGEPRRPGDLRPVLVRRRRR